jgi:hypothetical protein
VQNPPKSATVSNQVPTNPRRLKRKMLPLSHRLFQPAPTHPGNFSDYMNNFFSAIGTNLFLCQPHQQRECQRCPGAPGPPVPPWHRWAVWITEPAYNQNAGPPAPCLLFRPSVMTAVTSLLTYKVDLSNRPLLRHKVGPNGQTLRREFCTISLHGSYRRSCSDIFDPFFTGDELILQFNR